MKLFKVQKKKVDSATITSLNPSSRREISSLEGGIRWVTKISFFTLLIIPHLWANAQNCGEYYQFIDSAEFHYQNENYNKSALFYSQAFSVYSPKEHDVYNAACSWALINQEDTAFKYLDILTKDFKYKNYNHISNDSDFKFIKENKRWQKVLNRVKTSQIEYQNSINQPLLDSLEILDSLDQEPRINKNLKDKPWRFYDSITFSRLENLIKENGFLSYELVGKNGVHTVITILQHTSHANRLKYYPYIKEEFEKGHIDPHMYAIITDRIQLKEDSVQTYGTQYIRDPKSGKFYPSPIKDFNNIDSTRCSIGLSPYKYDLKYWDIDYEELKEIYNTQNYTEFYKAIINELKKGNETK